MGNVALFEMSELSGTISARPAVHRTTETTDKKTAQRRGRTEVMRVAGRIAAAEVPEGFMGCRKITQHLAAGQRATYWLLKMTR